MENDYIPNPTELKPGTTLNGDTYVIECKLGEGGFGITYKAIQKRLNRAVCIKEYFLSGRCARKTLSNTVVPNPTDSNLYNKYRESFAREALTLAELRHPGIVEVLDVFDENGTSYMVMTFIEGQSLQSIVEQRGPLPYAEAVNYIAQVADAVSYIHKRHILHRDIKPENIMITADYRAILIDFGSAREFEHDKTQAHTSLLTHGYAPSEQYTTTSRKGAYTDIYALGATFYFILTGRIPLAAAARITEQMPEPAQFNPQIPPAANRTIMKAMQLQPQARYQNVEDFMLELQNQTPAQKPSTQKLKRNNKWLLWLLVVLAILSILTAVIAVVVSKDDGGKGVSRSKDEFKTEIKDEFREQEKEPEPNPEPPQELETVKTFTVNGVSFHMRLVEGGTFTMGARTDEEISLAYKQEMPSHRVRLDSYYIGETEVTQELWRAVMGSEPSRNGGWEYEYGRGDDYPAYRVSYEECKEFIRRLNSATGRSFRLPTEAEWEFAARGGNKSVNYLYSGSDNIYSVAWIKENSDGHAHPVAQKSSNELGLYDMSGNVYEWCNDWYGDYTSDFQDNPQGSYSHTFRVHRGGSWMYGSRYCRNCYRSRFSADTEKQQYLYIGLRLAL